MAKYTARKYESDDGWTPPAINEFEEVGLNKGFMSDLILKTMYVRGQVSGIDLAESLTLPFQNVVHKVLSFLKLEQMCEIKGSGGLGAGTFEYVITSKGAVRAREQLERSAYVGPAPVPWEQYVESVNAQGSRRLKVNESMMTDALSHMVLNDSIFDKIGPAVNSGRSLFLYGPPGNGKTTIAESIGRMVLGNDMYIPYCVEVDGQIITVYDAINHESLEDDDPVKIGIGNRDGRWLKIKRPSIMVGGELTMEGLDLVWDTTNKFYEAPFQMKANGGMFLIDDFGRQMIRPRDLLNRWIVPMEKNIDFLALHTGRKIELPFSVLLVFCTNLPPADLVDEAFLRRIRHKIHVTSPSFDDYREIFRVLCKKRNIPEDEKALRYILQEYYIKKNRKLRASHPRDILDQLEDIGSYKGFDATLAKDLLDQAAESYFVDL